MNYIKEKCATLKDFGMTNSHALKRYFQTETKGLTGDAMENKVDRLSRVLLANFFDGDRTYVGAPTEAEENYYNTIKEKYNKALLYEETIINEVGKKGMRYLLNNELLQVNGKVKGKCVYVLKERVN